MRSQKKFYNFIILFDYLLVIWPASAFSVDITSSKNNLKEHLLFRQKCSFCDYSTQLCDTFCSPNELSSSEKADIHGLLKRPSGIEAFNCKYSSHKYLDPVHPLVCFQYHNSPYLGDFFSQPSAVSTLDDFKDIINVMNKRSNIFIFKSTNGLKPLQYDNIVRVATDESSEIVPLTVPGEIDGLGHCESNVPIKHLMNKNSKCFHVINRQNCLNNAFLNLGGFMVKTKEQHLKFPSILSGYSNNVISPNVKVLCIDNAMDYLSFNKNVFSNAGNDIRRNVNVVKCKDNNLNSLVNDQDICENVVVFIEYVFHMNGSEIYRLDQVYHLGNIPISFKALLPMSNYSDLVIKNFNTENDLAMYVSQEIILKFVHSMEREKKYITSSGYKMNDKILINYSKDSLNILNCQDREGCLNKLPKYLSLWSGK